MKLVSNQFGSSGSRSKGATSQSRNTELVTIGGTGGKRSQTGERHFKRLEDDNVTTTVTRTHSNPQSDGSSNDELPLTGIRVTNDVRWSERNASVATAAMAGGGKTYYHDQYQAKQ